MMTNLLKNKGFMLIELIAVITILSILATIAIAAYKEYGKGKYDSEAIAHMSSLYEQASFLVNEWGIGNGIEAGCRDIGPGEAGRLGLSGGPAQLRNNDLRLTLKGISHWGFRVCIGYIRNSTSEGVLVSAHREIEEGSERVIIMGSGITEPIVASEGGSAPPSSFSPILNLAEEENSSDSSLWQLSTKYNFGK